MVSIRLILALAGIMVAFVISTNAAYKPIKPPFNGSIFGKRSNTVTDEVANRALSAICEAASETCSAWLSHQESN
ncbi:PREDICTED: FMRFamide-related neuropeptides [Wasmannia auropunctata]|uniref:FMRFamide-related neuropeptides n=1 Tax=Wasmannia auropunctata TaxID=64793 RepID=UPI0005EF5977|nr:PREDICTED: FMRFamide-related neuropeptides [Wasmannia auropunctata]